MDMPDGCCARLPAPVRRSPDSELPRRTLMVIAIVVALLLVGRGVATALGSPLLGIVAVGMLFLTGVAVTGGAIGQDRR